MSEPLSTLVRAGKLASPIRRDFDRQRWAAEYASLAPNPETEGFYTSVMWFADQIEVIHRRIAGLRLERVDRDALVRELCGRCNYAYVHSEARLRQETMEAKPGELPMGSPAHVLFTTETGDKGNADAWRTGSTDTLGAALRHLFTIDVSKSGPAFGVAKLAEQAFGLFNMLYVLEFYCEKTVWQGWRVVEDGRAWRILPPGLDPFGRSSVAVDWRRDQEHGEWNIVAGMAWREERGFAEFAVVRDDRSGALKTILRTPGEGNIPQENVLRWTVTASDLEDVASEPLPAFASQRVTLNHLIDAALLIGSAGRVVTDELIALGPGALMRRFAPTLSVKEIDQLLVDLGWSQPKRAAVIEFFTYRGQALDGLWSKPLAVGKRGLIPILPAIVGPNLYRSAELWLAEAGGDALQRERGAAFEARVRRELSTALKAMKLQAEVQIAPPFSVKIAGARRDIDLALRIGRTVFIGEAKLKRFPAAPRENGRWIDELTKGAGQAKLRCEHFAIDPRAIAQQTGCPEEASALEFVPFVLASGSFGAGVAIADVPVIDFDGLKEFFDPGFFGAMGEMKPGSEIHATKVVPFRSEDADLATCLKAYLAEPVRVRVIEAAMIPLPRTIGVKAVDGRTILCTDPMVDHRRFAVESGDWLQAEAQRIWRAALAASPPVT